MAPEQLFDGHPSDERSDIWGLGLIAYEALVGRRPFEGRTRASIGLGIVMQRYDAVTAVRPELPAALDDVMGRALKLDATERYDSARAFREAFDQACEGEASAPSAPKRRARAGLRIPDALYGRDAELVLGRTRARDSASRPSQSRPRTSIGRSSAADSGRPPGAGP